MARRAGLTRGEALGLWVALLDRASVSRPRGSLAGFEAEELAALLELDAAAVATALAYLRERKMITAAGDIAGWDKMQKPSTRRTRAWRARNGLLKGRQPAKKPPPPNKSCRLPPTSRSTPP